MTSYRPGLVALLLAGLVAFFLLAPLIAIVPISLTPARFLSLPQGALSLTHYRELVTNPDWGHSVWLSVRIGLATSLIATSLALAFSVGIWMTQPPFSGVLVGLVLLPMIVPPVVSAMTLYFLLTALSRLSTAVGYDSFIGVTLAHVVVTAPFAVVLLLVALAQVDRRVDLAARGLGATVAQRAYSVILPNIRFGIATAAVLVFVLSWEEIGVTLFITSTDTITLPRLMWMGIHDNIDPAVAAMSVVLIAVTATLLGLRMALGRAEV